MAKTPEVIKITRSSRFPSCSCNCFSVAWIVSSVASDLATHSATIGLIVSNKFYLNFSFLSVSFISLYSLIFSLIFLKFAIIAAPIAVSRNSSQYFKIKSTISIEISPSFLIIVSTYYEKRGRYFFLFCPKRSPSTCVLPCNMLAYANGIGFILRYR